MAESTRLPQLPYVAIQSLFERCSGAAEAKPGIHTEHSNFHESQLTMTQSLPAVALRIPAADLHFEIARHKLNRPSFFLNQK
jgi:hypothetical protein